MKKLLWIWKRCKKGFTLMECVCAITVVAMISALVIPLMADASRSFRKIESLRKMAGEASYKSATTATTVNASNPDADNTEKLYVIIRYNDLNVNNTGVDSSFNFTKTEVTDDNSQKVTYYELKNGKEEETTK